jgi:hypothetical protein
MARQKKIKPSEALLKPREYRLRLGQNQGRFWMPLGTTQSGGSRYESERAITTPVALLLVLREAGKISDEDLADARAVVEATRRTQA